MPSVRYITAQLAPSKDKKHDHAPTCRTRKMHRVCASFLFAAYLPPTSTNTTPPCTEHQRRDTVSRLWCLVHHCSACTLQRQETRPYECVSCSWASASPSMKNVAYIGHVFCVGHLTSPPHLPKTGNVPNVVHFRCLACLYPLKTRNATPLGCIFHVWHSLPSINSHFSYLYCNN